jgi:hypothetical protein
VRFACSTDSSSNKVVSIKEPTTCHYVLVFHTPVLCTHQAFKTQEQPVRRGRTSPFEIKQTLRVFYPVFFLSLCIY